jgi:hypothetical protein
MVVALAAVLSEVYSSSVSSRAMRSITQEHLWIISKAGGPACSVMQSCT